jgi:predicted nucleic acid-binding protein
VKRGLTLDAGALIAYERGKASMRALVAAAQRDERPVWIPAVAVAEAWRGGNARWLNGLLGAAAIEPTTDLLARRAGELLARTRLSNTVDALVAVSAAQRGDIVVTSDPVDMHRFAADLKDIRIRQI